MAKPSRSWGSGAKSCETSRAWGSVAPSAAGKPHAGRCATAEPGSSSAGGDGSGSSSGRGSRRRSGHERPWRGPECPGRDPERPDRGSRTSGPDVARSRTGSCAGASGCDVICSPDSATGPLTCTAVTCAVATGRAAIGEVARWEPTGFLVVIACRPARPGRILPVLGVFGRSRDGDLCHTRTETEMSSFSAHGAIRHQVRGSDR
jgi:hypothetical protein